MATSSIRNKAAHAYITLIASTHLPHALTDAQARALTAARLHITGQQMDLDAYLNVRAQLHVTAAEATKI